MKKLKSNWRTCSLESLENHTWGSPSDDSHLINRCHALRKIPLDQFTTEDLRIMIGQEISVEYLLPIALETLAKDLFAEGDFYPGDLLNSVLNLSHSFWNVNKDHYKTLSNILEGKRHLIKEKKIKTTNFDNANPFV